MLQAKETGEVEDIRGGRAGDASGSIISNSPPGGGGA
jgi:hypothetical protein